MPKWWNVVTEIRVPYDTEEEAIAAGQETDDLEALMDLYGDNAVISGHIEEMSEE